MTDPLTMKTNVTVEVHDAVTGELLAIHRRHNLVTLAGRNLVRDALNGTSTKLAVTAIAVGTGGTAAASGQTALVTETNRSGTSQRSVSDGVMTAQRYLGTNDANGQTLKEAGIFCGSVMFARVVFPDVVKTSASTVTITWSVSIGAGA